jgi:arsenate reductase (thioredoxin)
MRGVTGAAGEGGMNEARRAASTVLFVCLHGSAKSLIAAEHLARLARSRGVPVRAESVGIEPDPDVPPHVVAGLAGDGIDVRGYTPRAATADRLAEASHIISFGCDVGTMLPASVFAERWDEVPLVSEGYDAARDVIVQRVKRLLEAL